MLLDPRAPETLPKSAGAGAGAEMHPRVCSRAGFFQSRGFACGRVFAKPAPTPAGAIPSAESAPLNDKTKSLVLMNYFPSVPVKFTACLQHSQNLIDMVNTCYGCDVTDKLKL